MERNIKKMEFEFSTQAVTLWPWEYHYYEPPGACNHTDMYYCHPQNRCESCQSRALESTWTAPVSVSVSSSNKYSAQEQSNQPQNNFPSIPKPIIKPAHVLETYPASNEIQICKSSKCRVYESTTKTCFICSDHTDKLLSLISWVQVESLTKSVPDYDVMSPSPSPSPSYCSSGGSLSSRSSDGRLLEDKGESVFYDRSLPGPGPGPGAWHSESCGKSGLDSEHFNIPHSEETETASKAKWKSYFQSRTFSQEEGDYLEADKIQAERRIRSKKSRSVGKNEVYSRSQTNPVMRCASAASISDPSDLITTMGSQNLLRSCHSASNGYEATNFEPTSLEMCYQDTSQAILISSSPLLDQEQEHDVHTLNGAGSDPDALRERSCFDKSLVTDSDNRKTLNSEKLEQVAQIISPKSKPSLGFLQTGLEQCDDENENEVQLFTQIFSEVRQCSSDVDVVINGFLEVSSTIQQIQIQATEATQGSVVGPGLQSSMILASAEERPTSTSHQSNKKIKRKKLEKQKRLDAILVDKESILSEKRRADEVFEADADAGAELGGPTNLKGETLVKTKNNPVQTKNQTDGKSTIGRSYSVNQLCGSKPKLQIKEQNSSFASHCSQSSYISKIKELKTDTRTPQLVRLQALQSCRFNLRFASTSSIMPDEDSSDESQSNEDMESSKKHCQYQNVSQMFATHLQFTTTDAEHNVGNNFRSKVSHYLKEWYTIMYRNRISILFHEAYRE